MINLKEEIKNEEPIEIRLEKSKKEIISNLNKVIKENNLSFYLLDIIYSEIYAEIKEARKKEIVKINEIIGQEERKQKIVKEEREEEQSND